MGQSSVHRANAVRGRSMLPGSRGSPTGLGGRAQVGPIRVKESRGGAPRGGNRGARWGSGRHRQIQAPAAATNAGGGSCIREGQSPRPLEGSGRLSADQSRKVGDSGARQGHRERCHELRQIEAPRSPAASEQRPYVNLTEDGRTASTACRAFMAAGRRAVDRRGPPMSPVDPPRNPPASKPRPAHGRPRGERRRPGVGLVAGDGEMADSRRPAKPKGAK
jgi:hypothetical protein